MAGVVRYLPAEPRTTVGHGWTAIRIMTAALVVWAALVVGYTVTSIRESNESNREWRESLDKLRAGSYTSPREYWRER